MSLFESILIWLLLIWSGYHLVRDLLQDVLHIHHPLIDVGHIRPVHKVKLLGKFYSFWAIPIEGIVFLLAIKSLSANEFGLLGQSALILFITFLIFWIWTWTK